MKKLLPAAFAAAILLSATAGNAAEVWNTAGQSLRAGPGLRYPAVADVRPGTKLTAAGCLKDGTWCNVEKADGTFGWVRAALLDVPMHGEHVNFLHATNESRPQVVDYNVKEYWDEHYRHSKIYAERGRYGYNAAPNNRPPEDRVEARGQAHSVDHRTPRMLDDEYYSK